MKEGSKPKTYNSTLQIQHVTLQTRGHVQSKQDVAKRLFKLKQLFTMVGLIYMPLLIR